MTDDDRRHFNNLIVLCDECHSMIDNKNNESKYTKEVLLRWKLDHETNQTYTVLNDRPSLLNTVINAISDIKIDEESKEFNASASPFNIDEKIQYNKLVRNKALIDEYKVFYNKVNSLYQTLETQGSFKKDNLLRNIKVLYTNVKGRYVGDNTNPSQIIRENSDNIFEDVQDKLIEMAEHEAREYIEDISFGVTLVMVDAFMRCKILEEPQP